MYDKKPSKTIAIYKYTKTKIPVNYLFTGIFYYLLIISNRLLLHFFKIYISNIVITVFRLLPGISSGLLARICSSLIIHFLT